MRAIEGRFEVPIFDCNVHIIVTNNICYALKRRGFVYGEDVILDCEPSGYFIRIDPNAIGNYHILFNIDDLATDIINHEKSHLVEQILIDRKMKAKDELRAYLDAFISRKIDAFFKKHPELNIKNRR